MKCPICGSTAKMYYKCSHEKNRLGYLKLYSEDIDDLKLDIGDYDLLQCNNCKLVFSNPMISGSQNFYSWVTSHKGYYPTKNAPRWEWKEIWKFLKENNEKKTDSVLEIGCGEGDFLELCAAECVDIKKMGIDTTLTSCEKCWSKGINVFCGTIDDYLKSNEKKEVFDLVVAFHCLEHVKKPLELVKQMLSCTSEQGLCILSFPYSNTVMEPWHDCNNLPPHHMTRWNERACKELGKQLGCSVKLVSPSPMGDWEETLENLKMLWYSNEEKELLSYKKFLLKCFLHPYTFIKEYKRNMYRDKINASETIGGICKNRKSSHVVMLILSKETSYEKSSLN